ncbi:MAG: RDD family protein [Clostridia bacterium]|nr:RDD family protein [Clostridia bacterium]
MEMKFIKKYYNALILDSAYILLMNLPLTIISAIWPDNIIIRWIFISYFVASGILYYALFQIYKKATPGMKMSGLIIVNKDGSVPTKKAILKRFLYAFPWSMVFIVSILTDYDLQKWEKRVLGTILTEK